MNSFFDRYQKFAPLFLRFGLSAVFVIFGVQKLLDPGQATREIELLAGLKLADAAALNYYLGLFEILLAISLVIGFKVRVAAVITSLLMATFFILNIKSATSINPEIYRDLGLVGNSVALFLLGAGPLSLDSWLSQKGKSDSKAP